MERNRTYKEVVHGEKVLFNEIQPRDYFDTYEALRHGYFNGQQRFHLPEVGITGGLEISKVSKEVILTPEQEHLIRPTQEELRWNKRLI